MVSKFSNYWNLIAKVNGFTVGKVYQAVSQNEFNVALKNDNNEIVYVPKKLLCSREDE